MIWHRWRSAYADAASKCLPRRGGSSGGRHWCKTPDGRAVNQKWSEPRGAETGAREVGRGKEDLAAAPSRLAGTIVEAMPKTVVRGYSCQAVHKRP
jgi:hypothetical protein